MALRIGNFLFLMGIGSAFLSATPSLELKLNTLEGTPVSTLEAGRPYLLEIIGTDLSTSPDIFIPGLDSVYHESRGAYQTITSINGRTRRTTKITYCIRADKPGFYSFGPIEVTEGKTTLTAQPLIVEAKPSAKPLQLKQNAPAFLEVASKDETVFVGQPIEVTITLFVRSDIIISQCSLPSVSSPLFDKINWGIASQGLTRKNNISYRYAQWQTTIIPSTAEPFIIPAARIICTLQKQRTAHAFMNTMLQHFGFHSKQEEIFSNPLTINVESLPSYKGHVDGIGCFDALWLDIKPLQAKVGEGIIATLTIIGNEGLESLTPPSLDLPPNLRYYPSKTIVEKEYSAPDKQAKICEYIIQANEAGSYNIPSQSFTFFDYKKRVYSTLTSEPFRLVITPQESKPPQQSFVNDVKTPSLCPSHSMFELNKSGPWLARSSSPFSWKIFFVFLIIPFLFYGPFLYRYSVQQVFRYETNSRSYLAQAKEQILTAKTNNHSHKLYDIFMQLNANVLNKNRSTITEKDIEEFLHVQGLSKSHIHQWQQFIQKCAQRAYTTSLSQDSSQLFESAQRWLVFYQERLL